MGANNTVETMRAPSRSQTGRHAGRTSQVYPQPTGYPEVPVLETLSDTSSPRSHATQPEMPLSPPSRAHCAFEPQNTSASRTVRRSPQCSKLQIETRRVFVLSPGDSEDDSVGPELEGGHLESGAFYLRSSRSPSCRSSVLTSSPTVSPVSETDPRTSVGADTPPFFKRLLKRRPTPFSLLSLSRSSRGQEPPITVNEQQLEQMCTELCTPEGPVPIPTTSISELNASSKEEDIDKEDSDNVELLLQVLNQRSFHMFNFPTEMEGAELTMEGSGLQDRPSSVYDAVEVADIPDLCHCCLSAVAAIESDGGRLHGTCLACALNEQLTGHPLVPAAMHDRMDD